MAISEKYSRTYHFPFSPEFRSWYTRKNWMVKITACQGMVYLRAHM
jgi:hypothetical protein